MNLRVVYPTARIQRKLTWRRPSAGIDQLTRSLWECLNYQIHLLAHISELEYQIFHNIVRMFVNMLTKNENENKSDPHVVQNYVAASAVSRGKHDALPWKQ